MSWSKSFDKVTRASLSSEVDAFKPTVTYNPEGHLPQVDAARECALALMAAHGGDDATLFSVSMNGHANGPTPSQGDTIGVYVGRST